MSDGIAALRAALPDSQAEEALCWALTELGWFELTTGDLAAAGTALTEAHDRQRHMNDDRGRCTTLAWIGRLHWQASRWAEAEEALNESLELAKPLGDRLKVATARRHLGLLEWNRGNYAEAHALHEDALEAYQRVGDKYGEAASLLNIAAVHFDEGNYAEAKVLVDKANALCLEIHAPDFHSYGLLYDGKIAIREGRFEEGLDLTRAAIEKLEEGNYSAFYIGMSKRAAGEALLGLERLDEAQIALEQARAIYEQLGSRVQYAKCLHWLGCLDERRGLGGSNRWREALEIFEAMGAAADARRTLRVLEEGGYG